jgi:hemerythrin-like metal-binding protein
MSIDNAYPYRVTRWENGLRDEKTMSGVRAPFILPPSLLIGLVDIDEEHQHLIDIIYDVETCTVTRQHVQDIIASLSEHFAHEERTMRETGYPQLAEHSAHHRAVLARMQEISNRRDGAGAPVNDLLHALLDDILRADLPFKSFLQGKGLVAV